MLCKKCKTAVPEQERRCPYCGTRQRRGRRLKQAVSAVCACALALACCTLIYLDRVGLAPWDADGIQAAAPPNATEEPAQTPPPADDADPTPVPTATADLQKAMEDVWAMLEDAYRGAMLYMAANATDNAFVSQNGYLYNASARAYVTAQTLLETKMLDSRYAGDKILFLYLRPADTEPFPEVSFGKSLAPALFAAYETQDGVALFGAGNARGVLYRESMNGIFEVYASSHGAVRRCSAADEVYGILRALVAAELLADAPDAPDIADDTDAPVKTGVDIRYLAADEKYACVVASAASSSDRLRTFIAENTAEGWLLLPAATEGARVLAEAVNRAVPGFSVALLPDYEPAKAVLYPAESFAFITDFMLTEGSITADDMPVDFVSGNGEMMYMELTSGLRFFGRYSAEEQVWKMFSVQNWMEAELLIRGGSQNAAVCILRQE